MWHEAGSIGSPWIKGDISMRGAHVRRCGCIGFAGIVLLGGTTVLADGVWSQPGGSGSAGGYVGSSPNIGYTVADDFSLSASTHITRIHWWGSALSSGNVLQTDPLDGIQTFVLGIWSDSSSLPGSTEFTPISVNATLVSTYSDAVSGYTTGVGYRYELDLAANSLDFTLGSSTYWLQIIGESTTSSKAWAWQYLSSGDGSAFKYEGGSWQTYSLGGMAFELNPTSIPLPMPVLLAGVGLVGMVPLRRRVLRGQS